MHNTLPFETSLQTRILLPDRVLVALEVAEPTKDASEFEKVFVGADVLKLVDTAVVSAEMLVGPLSEVETSMVFG